MKGTIETVDNKIRLNKSQINSEILVTNCFLINETFVNRWLKFAAVSEKSMATYTICLKQLARYFVENHISTPTRENLENWRDELIDAGKSAATVCLYLTACKLFFRWLAQEGIFPNIADNLKSRVKISTTHKKDTINTKQATALLKSVEGKSLKALRDSAIISLMLTTGIRSIEVVRANIADIRQINGEYFLFVQGKGRSEKSDSVLIAKGVYKKIQSYLKARGKTAMNQPLFVSTSRRNKNARLDTQTIRKMVKYNLRKIGVDTPTVSCHSLRHFAACTMIEQGQELYNVQMVLRHKNISTTMIYLNCVNRMKNHAEISVAKVLKI